jgi:hypothetical protein
MLRQQPFASVEFENIIFYLRKRGYKACGGDFNTLGILFKKAL